MPYLYVLNSSFSLSDGVTFYAVQGDSHGFNLFPLSPTHPIPPIKKYSLSDSTAVTPLVFHDTLFYCAFQIRNHEDKQLIWLLF